MQKRYTQRTAALQATTIDARVVDTKKLKVSGKDITELIGQSSGGVKRIRVAGDTREVITQNDIWDSYVEQGQNGQVIIHTKDKIDFSSTTNEYGEIQAWNNNIIRVEDNKAYIGKDFTDDGFTGEEFYANVKVEKIENGQNMFSNNLHLTTFSGDLTSLKNGNSMFYYCGLQSFDSDLSSLKDGNNMFSCCDNLTTFYSDLSSLIIGEGMFTDCDNLTSFDSDLSSLEDGTWMFYYCSNLTTFYSDLSSLTNGTEMFGNCTNLTNFESNLSSLKDGYSMFSGCTSLNTFTSDLSALTNGSSMFRGCTNLTTFASDLSSLKYGNLMFGGCTNLTNFDSDLNSLEDGTSMFNGCTSLNTFTSDLSALTNGNRMFRDCTNLTTFASDLSSLEDGTGMFYYVPIENFMGSVPSLLTGLDMFGKDFDDIYDFDDEFGNEIDDETSLSRESLEYIADSINDLAEKGLATKTQEGYWSYSMDWDDENWNKDCFIDPNYRGVLSLGIISEDNLDLCQEIANKGWTVLINSWESVSPTQSISLDDQLTVTPKPYYAKPVSSDEKRGRYINANGEYFNIIGGNTILGADLSSFGMFTSLQDAMANMGLTKVEKSFTKKK